MGYPIPDDPDIAQFAYYLVAIPDDPIYRQAVKGHLGELGNARFWGREGITPDSYIAAQSWLRAINETWRLIEMGWPDLVLQYIDELEEILAGMNVGQAYEPLCCAENATFDPPAGGGSSTDPVPDPIVDAGYAADGDDQTSYSAYKCMAAHLLLNNFQQKLIDLSPIATAGGAILSLLLVLFGSITGLTGVVLAGIAIGLGDLVSLVDALKDIGAVSLTGLAEDIEDNRDEIVCAIVGGDGIDDAIDQFNNKIDALFNPVEATIIKNLNVRHMFQLLLYGENRNKDIAAELAAAGYDPDNYECCVEESDLYFNTGITGQYYRTLGSDWLPFNTLIPIVYGQSYDFQGPAGDGDVQVTITDIDDNFDAIGGTWNTNLPSGNGLLWHFQKPDNSWWENGILHMVPGDYPITYNPVRFWRARQNVIWYGSAYWVTITPVARSD